MVLYVNNLNILVPFALRIWEFFCMLAQFICLRTRGPLIISKRNTNYSSYTCNLKMMQEASKRRYKKIKFISLSFVSKLFSQKILILEYFICYY